MMEREILAATFDEYADTMLRYAQDAVSPTDLLTGRRIPVADRLLRDPVKRVVDRNLRDVYHQMRAQRDVVLDYAADLAIGVPHGQCREAYRDDFLATNPVATRIALGTLPAKREAIEDELLDHLTRVAHDVAPLYWMNADAFDDGMRRAYDREQARDMLTGHLDAVEQFLDYRSDIAVTVDVSLPFPFSDLTLDVTGDALAVLEEGRDRLQEEIAADIDAIYR